MTDLVVNGQICHKPPRTQGNATREIVVPQALEVNSIGPAPEGFVMMFLFFETCFKEWHKSVKSIA